MTTDPAPPEQPSVCIELLASLRPLFAAAFEAASFGEPLSWDITWALIGVDGSPKPMLFCYVHTPAPFPLGVFLQRWWIMELASNELAINTAVRQRVEELKAQRMEMVYQSMASGNGAPAGPVIPGKIIIPGN